MMIKIGGSKKAEGKGKVAPCFYFSLISNQLKLYTFENETNKVYHSFMLSCSTSEEKEVFGGVPKISIAERFLENQFCMFQPFKGKQNLGVFKAVLKLASYQLWLSVQIWAGSTKEILNSLPPSARFSTFSRVRSVLRGCFVFEGAVRSRLSEQPLTHRSLYFLPTPQPLCFQGFALSMAQSTGLQLNF